MIHLFCRREQSLNMVHPVLIAHPPWKLSALPEEMTFTFTEETQLLLCFTTLTLINVHWKRFSNSTQYKAMCASINKILGENGNLNMLTLRNNKSWRP